MYYSRHPMAGVVLLVHQPVEMCGGVLAVARGTIVAIISTHKYTAASSFSAMTFCTQRKKALSNWTINSNF